MINNTLPLPMDRKIMFAQQVNQATIENITKQIIAINENDEFLKKLYPLYGINGYEPMPIKIYIDSYGGAVYQILGLISVIEDSKVPVHTICTGTAMSCGFMLLVSGHERFCHKHSTMLYHQVSSGARGTVKDMDEATQEAYRLQQKLEQITLARTKIKVKQLKDVYNSKTDWVISPAKAKQLGIVDEIL